MTDIILDVKNLSLSWEGNVYVSDVSLSLKAGEIVAIIGKSGCGKSTLLHAISGLTKPDTGHILLKSADITNEPGHISYMLQKDLLIPQKTILDNVILPLTISGTSKAEAKKIASKKFSEFGIEGKEDRYPSELSGGMRQRAALLRTSLMNNEVVLLDEPFSALDELTRIDMRIWFLNMLHSLKFTCILVTHSIEEAIYMSDRILVMSGSPATITSEFNSLSATENEILKCLE